LPEPTHDIQNHGMTRSDAAGRDPQMSTRRSPADTPGVAKWITPFDNSAKRPSAHLTPCHRTSMGKIRIDDGSKAG